MRHFDMMLVATWFLVACLALRVALSERARRRRLEREAAQRQAALAAFWKTCSVREDMRTLDEFHPIQDEYEDEDSEPTVRIPVRDLPPPPALSVVSRMRDTEPDAEEKAR